MVNGLGVLPESTEATVTIVDNTSAMKLAHNMAVNRRNKNRYIRFHFTLQTIEEGTLD